MLYMVHNEAVVVDDDESEDFVRDGVFQQGKSKRKKKQSI